MSEVFIPDCDECGEPLTDTVFFVEGLSICERCFEGKAYDMSYKELAVNMGYDYTDLESYMESLEDY